MNKLINKLMRRGGGSVAVADKQGSCRKLILGTLLLMATTFLLASEAPPVEKKIVRAEVYGGVVVDQTITMIGEEFYQLFTTLWNEKANAEAYSILIRERPSARLGSQIWIDAGQKRIFQAPLPTNRARMREMAEQAVDISYDNLVGADIQMLLFPEPDLGRDEM